MQFKDIKFLIKNIELLKNGSNLCFTGGNSFEYFIKKINNKGTLKKLNLNYFISDERYHGKDIEHSNSLNIIKKLYINYEKNNFHFPNMFQKNLKKICQDYIKKLPKKLDIIILSMGEDCHYASVFPKDKKVFKNKNKFFQTKIHKQYLRFSLSPDYINLSRKKFILVKGIKRQKILKKAMSSKLNYLYYPIKYIKDPIFIYI